MINDFLKELKYCLDETMNNICNNGLTKETKEEMDNIFSLMLKIHCLAEEDDDLKTDIIHNITILFEDFLEAKHDNGEIFRLCCEMEEISDWIGEELA